MPLGFEISQDIEFDRSDYNLVNWMPAGWMTCCRFLGTTENFLFWFWGPSAPSPAFAGNSLWGRNAKRAWEWQLPFVWCRDLERLEIYSFVPWCFAVRVTLPLCAVTRMQYIVPNWTYCGNWVHKWATTIPELQQT
jgi:hypothetical protein